MTKKKPARLRVLLFQDGLSEGRIEGERVILNEDTKIAYWMGPATDALAREGKVPVELHPGIGHTNWANLHGYKVITREPTDKELLT